MTELEATNIALRGLNEPAVAALADSPLATIARDRLLEISARNQFMGPWAFSGADYRLPISAGNGDALEAGEELTEGTSTVTMTLLAVDATNTTTSFAYVRKEEGTPLGGLLLTGGDSEATRTAGALPTRLNKDAPWAIADLPTLFARWCAWETAAELQEEYKRSTVDAQFLDRKVNRARVEYREWDALWSELNIHQQADLQRLRDGFRRGPGWVSEY